MSSCTFAYKPEEEGIEKFEGGAFVRGRSACGNPFFSAKTLFVYPCYPGRSLMLGRDAMVQKEKQTVGAKNSRKRSPGRCLCS